MLAYAVTIFLGAFLLFQVELVIGKYVLPWFGGTPAVWTTCMLFFQVALLAGYAYAHWLIRKLGARRQSRLHVALIIASLCAIAAQFLLWRSPILPSAGWKPGDSAFPILRILGLLCVSIGVPFFVLSATSPLLQAWFGRAHPGRSPYKLYALSNAGSMLGLLSYPFLVEPGLALRSQAWTWSACYAAFAVACIWCASRASKSDGAISGDVAAPTTDDAAAPTRGRRLLWFSLAACASVLLLATTNQMSEETAVVPFLWVLQLALYLLSFILCFADHRAYSRTLFVCAAIAAIALTGSPHAGTWRDVNIITYIWTASFALFVACMICHGELARLKPSTRHLTSFYLTVSAGGAAGGVFVALIAPVIFTGLWELYLGQFACAILLLAVMFGDRTSRFNGRRRLFWRTVALMVLVVLGGTQALQMKAFYENTVTVRRNFYGILRVKEKHPEQPDLHQYALLHGRTIHGSQYVTPARRRLPTAYYIETGGAGIAIRQWRRLSPGRPMRMGMVGLGTGTLATYGRKGDYVRFYEINPAVIAMASGDDACFSFLEDSAARIDIALGDARILLDGELAQSGSQRFDILVLDAFSGDAVPLHLLTREAFATYVAHIRKNGVLAVHISNRYFDLRPVMWRMAREFGLHAVAVRSAAGEDGVSARWMLLTRNPSFVREVANFVRRTAKGTTVTTDKRGGKTVRLWTDDYSNLLQVLK